jgi:hypothetical protein
MTSRRLRKTREDPTAKLARTILPEVQIARGGLVRCQVANHTEADVRDAASLKRTETVRRVRLKERLRHQIDEQEADACQWYADAFEARYGTISVIGNYGDRGMGPTDFCHAAKTSDQDIAGEHFTFARAGIAPPLRPMFERIVLHGWGLNPSITTLFRMAARQLMHRIEGEVSW